MTGCQNIEKVDTQGKIVDGKEVIAKVNDEYILKSDYDRQVAQVKVPWKLMAKIFPLLKARRY